MSQETITQAAPARHATPIGRSGVSVRPEHRVRKHDDGVTLYLALPGVRKEDVHLSAEQGVLTVVAERNDAPPENWKVHHAAPQAARYELRVRLHEDLDPNRVAAQLRDGVLTLAIERHEAARPRTIAVQ